MKNVFFVVLVILSLTTYSQTLGGLSFESKVGNYGEIKLGAPAEIEFVFKNTSEKTIEIKDIK